MKKGCLIALAIFGGLVVLVIIGLVILGVVGYKVTQTPQFKKNFDESFKTSYKASFVENCSKQPIPNAEKVCTCMADYMLTNYTSSELTSLGLKTPAEIQKSDIITKSATACANPQQ